MRQKRSSASGTVQEPRQAAPRHGATKDDIRMVLAHRGKYQMRRLLLPLALLIPTVAQTAEPALSFAALEAAHAEPGSKFIDLIGMRVHYTDEGTGPAVVLLNASYLNLSSWDGVAQRLRSGHRVIRVDFPSVGLTGPAPDSMLNIRGFETLVLALMDRLGVERTTLVGTSSGAIVAVRLAADQPQRFDRLVLVNAAGLPRTAATNPIRPRERPPGAPPVGSRAFWSENLRANFADPSKVGEPFVTEVYDWNRRVDSAREAQTFLAAFKTGDPQAVLAAVRAPTLILWGEKGITLSHLEAEVFAQWLTGTAVEIRKYPDAGHYPQVEKPEAVAADIAAFIAGRLDPKLRPPPGPSIARLEQSPFWQRNAGLWLGENVYLSATGERKIDGYSSLTDTRVDGADMEEIEHRFYPPSAMAEAMAAGQLRVGEGLELVTVQRGHLADGAGLVVLAGQKPGARAEVQPLTSSSATMTVRLPPGEAEAYRIHIDLTAPDGRIRTFMGFEGGANQGALRAIALFRETRQPALQKAALLAALRQRYNVAVVTEPDASGTPVTRRKSAPAH